MACGVVYIFWVNKAFTDMARLPMLRKVGPLGHSMKWNGATWLFAGTGNRDRFKVVSEEIHTSIRWLLRLGGELGVRGFKRSRCLEDFRRQALYVRTRMCLVPVVSLWSR